MLDEIAKLQDAYQNLVNLDKSGKLRVLLWLINQFELEAEIVKRLPANTPGLATSPVARTEVSQQTAFDYQTLSQSELVLVLACELATKGMNAFQARHISQELNRHSLKLANVAKVLNDLVKRRLIAQVKLPGQTTQRKLYRLTTHGQTEAKLLITS